MLYQVEFVHFIRFYMDLTDYKHILLFYENRDYHCSEMG